MAGNRYQLDRFAEQLRLGELHLRYDASQAGGTGAQSEQTADIINRLPEVRKSGLEVTWAQPKTVEVVLDELPFGDFAEIEGPDTAAIQAAALALGLIWEARCAESYLGLFALVRASQGLDAQNLTFQESSDKTNLLTRATSSSCPISELK
jgi:hypothetical protein